MSQVAPQATHEPVEATPRRPITLARKKRAHALVGGLCAVCGLPVALDGPTVVYDHEITVWMGGADDDGPNWRPIHRDPCDKAKTRADQGDIGHVRRMKAKHEGTAKRGKPIPQRVGFKWPSRKLQSRGFRT